MTRRHAAPNLAAGHDGSEDATEELRERVAVKSAGGDHMTPGVRTAEIVVLRYSDDDPEYATVVEGFREKTLNMQADSMAPFCVGCGLEFSVDDAPPHTLVAAVPPPDDPTLPAVCPVCDACATKTDAQLAKAMAREDPFADAGD